MAKNLIIIFVLVLFAGMANAGSYENALLKNDKVFLYLYTPECHTCKAFDSIFDDIKSQHKDFAFVRVNANTSYGMQLISKFRARYVPYIILTNSKTKKSVNVNHSCVMNEVCLERAVKSFKG